MIDKAVVELVKNRAAGYCEVCGSPALESMALHHRKLKSRGGKDTVANLIYVHHSCHNLGSYSIHLNPEIATKKGYMVSSWQDPEQAPMITPEGFKVLLSDDGTTRKFTEAQ